MRYYSFIFFFLIVNSISSQTCLETIVNASGINFTSIYNSVESSACDLKESFEGQIEIGIYDSGLYSINRSQGQVQDLISGIRSEAQSRTQNYILFVREINEIGAYSDISIFYNLENSISPCLDAARNELILQLFQNLNYTTGETGENYFLNAIAIFKSQLNYLLNCCNGKKSLTGCCVDDDILTALELTKSVQSTTHQAILKLKDWDPCDGWQTMSDKYPNNACVGDISWVPLCALEEGLNAGPEAYGSVGFLDGLWAGLKSMVDLIADIGNLIKFFAVDNPIHLHKYYLFCHIHRVATIDDILTISTIIEDNDCDPLYVSSLNSTLSQELKQITSTIENSSNPAEKLTELLTLFKECDDLEDKMITLSDFPSWEQCKSAIQQIWEAIKRWEESFATSGEVASYCRGKTIAQFCIEVFGVAEVALGKFGSGAMGKVAKLMDNVGDNLKWLEEIPKTKRDLLIEEGLIYRDKPFKVPFAKLPKGLLDDFVDQPGILRKFMEGKLKVKAWDALHFGGVDDLIRTNTDALTKVDDYFKEYPNKVDDFKSELKAATDKPDYLRKLGIIKPS